MQETTKRRNVDPTLAYLRAVIGAEESWAKTEDRAARTAPARAAMEAKFLAEAAGDPVRAEHLRRAYYARLSLAAVKARRAKAAKKKAATR